MTIRCMLASVVATKRFSCCVLSIIGLFPTINPTLNAQAGLSSARAHMGTDCRREDVLPVSCIITSGESAFLQVCGLECRCE